MTSCTSETLTPYRAAALRVDADLKLLRAGDNFHLGFQMPPGTAEIIFSAVWAHLFRGCRGSSPKIFNATSPRVPVIVSSMRICMGWVIS